MQDICVKALDTSTWPDFARLIERQDGEWSGCWCMAFHAEGSARTKPAAQNRAEKETRVRQGRAHAALVYDGADCVGWCQFGPIDELPGIKHRREYHRDAVTLPDWRITCFFIESEYRHKGVATAALTGALREIARLGGGTVESYPEETDGRAMSEPFLYNGTLSMFESVGFRRSRPLGRNRWVVTKVVRFADTP